MHASVHVVELLRFWFCSCFKESNLRKNRTRYTGFVDKTLEAAKPISLVIPKAIAELSILSSQALADLKVLLHFRVLQIVS